MARPYTLCWRHVKLGRALLNHDDDDRDDDDRDDDDRDDDDDDAALATVAAHRRPGTARQTAARVMDRIACPVSVCMQDARLRARHGRQLARPVRHPVPSRVIES